MLRLEFADLFRFHNYMSIVFETIRTDRDPVGCFLLLLSYSLVRVMLCIESPFCAVKQFANFFSLPDCVFVPSAHCCNQLSGYDDSPADYLY